MSERTSTIPKWIRGNVKAPEKERSKRIETKNWKKKKQVIGTGKQKTEKGIGGGSQALAHLQSKSQTTEKKEWMNK